VTHSYVEHMANYPNSLLCRFYLFFSIQLNTTNSDKKIQNILRPKIFFVLMDNVFYSSLNVHRKFDLKGSTAGRHVTRKQLMSERSDSIIFKDLDFVGENDSLIRGRPNEYDLQQFYGTERKSRPRQETKTKEEEPKLWEAPKRLHLGKMKFLFLQQVKADTEWLAKQEIMDYSLLLGISFISTSSASENRGHRKMRTLIPLKLASPKHLQQLKNLSMSTWDELSATGERRSTFANTLVSQSTKRISIFKKDKGGLQSEGAEKPAIYFLGIIDICQKYNLRKLAETNVRGLVKEKTKISALPPRQYATRFFEFLSSISN